MELIAASTRGTRNDRNDRLTIGVRNAMTDKQKAEPWMERNVSWSRGMLLVGLFCEAQVGQKEPLRETVNKADNRPGNRR